MNGSALTLGVVGALALGAAVGRRGSASFTEVAAVLPEPGPPPAGMKPRWASSWTKGKAWAREQLLQHPATYDPRDALAVLDAADRKVIEDNTLSLPSLDRLEMKLRGGLIDRVRPKMLAEAARLRGVADRKYRGAASVDERAFWTGVGDYTAEVLGAATDADGMARAEALLDAVEANLVRAWTRRKREGSAARAAPVKRTLTDDQRLDVLGEALDRGAEGWGGMCGAAARAMNRVLFDGKGTLVAAVNRHLWKQGRAVGHVGIRHRGIVWDIEGTYEGDAIEEFRAWGMLDPEDSDYDLPNEQAAEGVVLLTGKDAERAADMMGCPRVDPEAVLLAARKAVVGW